MSVENSFLRKLIETKEWETVLNKDITADYFSGANKRAFKWLSDFKVKYGELPDKETFKKHFPEVNLNIESPETVGYYCDELRRKIRHNKLVTTLEKIDNLINDRDVDKCYTLLESLISEVNSDFTFTEKVDLGANTEKRFQDYLVNKATGGMTGIPLGIYPLDKQTGGIKEVDLISFLAKSGVGKTFLLCIIASNLIKAGYKTLFLTKEMSPHQILKRVDAIMSGVSYSRLKDGALTAMGYLDRDSDPQPLSGISAKDYSVNLNMQGPGIFTLEVSGLYKISTAFQGSEEVAFKSIV